MSVTPFKIVSSLREALSFYYSPLRNTFPRDVLEFRFKFVQRWCSVPQFNFDASWLWLQEFSSWNQDRKGWRVHFSVAILGFSQLFRNQKELTQSEKDCHVILLKLREVLRAFSIYSTYVQLNRFSCSGQSYDRLLQVSTLDFLESL